MIKNKKIIAATMILFTYILYKLMKKLLTKDHDRLDVFFTCPSFENLPFEIKNTPNFCLWKYEYNDSNKKVKVPYRYNRYKRKIVKGMGDYKSHLISSLDHYNILRAFGTIDHEFYLGLSLLGSKVSVIDIDHYQKHSVLDCILSALLQKGCYVEVSPSGQGLHIFYKGKLDWSYGKNRGNKTLDREGVSTSCEIYSFHDRRFITLTGKALKFRGQTSDQFIPTPDIISEELNKLQKLFFLDETKNISKQIKALDISLLERLTPSLEQLLSCIEGSKEADTFKSLCSEEKPAKYASPSEADMALAHILAKYTDANLPEADQIQVIRLAFLQSRLPRLKLQNRPEYVLNTVRKALDSLSLSSISKPISIATESGKTRQVSKRSIVKVCNVMKMFHFGQTFENHIYQFNKEDNELTVKMPKSLNQLDFKYFAELLFQYVDSLKFLKGLTHEQIKKELLVVSISTMLKNTGVSDGGRNYKVFLASLKRLSQVHISCNKIIDKKKQCFSKSAGSLITYEYKKPFFKNSETAKKQLLVRMHPVIIDMALESKYNYAILNKDSYHSLDSDKTKLLYYHFCLSTLPGGRPVTFSINDLLKLWPNRARTRVMKHKRKRELEGLLNSLTQQIYKRCIQDLSIDLVYDQKNSLESVIVQKHHLQLV